MPTNWLSYIISIDTTAYHNGVDSSVFHLLLDRVMNGVSRSPYQAKES